MNTEKKVWKYELNIKGQTKIQTNINHYHIKIGNELIHERSFPKTKEHVFKLKEVSYELMDYEDPVAKQIVEMTNMLCVIYEDLHFVVDKYGRLKKLLNVEEVREKWEKVKAKLVKEHPLMSFDVIRAKEFELSNLDMELRNLSFIHFIHTYFFMFGRTETDGYFDIEEMDRFGNGVVIPVGVVYSHRATEEGKMLSKFRGDCRKKQDATLRLRKAVKDDKAHLFYKMEGESIYDDAGMLAEAELTIEEQIGENYFTHNYVTLKEYADA